LNHIEHYVNEVNIITILAVDLGTVRTGIAACDKSEILAFPVGVYTETGKALLRKVVEIASEHKAEMIVVGLPLNMDGTKGESALKCEEFAAKLQNRIKIPVEMIDERLTTVVALDMLSEGNMKNRSKKHIVDAAAAVVILEDFLCKRKNAL